MSKITKPRFKSLVLGHLPHDDVARAIGVPVAPGIVRCSAGAQLHAYARHGEQFLVCHAYLAQTVTAPTYIGQGPSHRDRGFEMILDVAGPADRSLNVLVAVGLRPVGLGVYGVYSCYPIDSASISRRLRKGFLIRR